MKKLLAALFSLTLFVSCVSSDKDSAPEPAKDYREQNEQEIKDYIAKNNLTAQRTDSGLYYIINEPGTGKQPTSTSSVTVAYTGSFTSGKTFDQSSSAGITFPLTQVIQGWTEGIPLFKEGGSGTLLIPAHLGYGSYDRSGIPGGSVLIFDVKLIKVN
ncbi:FKBP-type peptidyl-prolyl cis-trans isomerase FkpA [Flavobacterium nitrogenifigens]|uniref:Peptidyl-prolyl cis-trans isomerase n=2 Tax=Flavobacterium TaxID=237 RepID=A0A7W7IVV1_9FLAO|nr:MULTISPECIES: FKBP-type peptidyl-prolyl cis-trans isomerase [Flavobacterium]MBB4801400.1 FKBP-type peptidyl-prolyl cis-trans isomerase FkpA [Flavobacterium nitrogenifigens]MBB6386357.1 FKBP-type peptidyl-prolyl cis-trans isomerase FkpA [Flavobacterium notoginsengisoli]